MQVRESPARPPSVAQRGSTAGWERPAWGLEIDIGGRPRGARRLAPPTGSDSRPDINNCSIHNVRVEAAGSDGWQAPWRRC